MISDNVLDNQEQRERNKMKKGRVWKERLLLLGLDPSYIFVLKLISLQSEMMIVDDKFS